MSKKWLLLFAGRLVIRHRKKEEALMSGLINITGPIAAGATTLANRLVELMSWESLVEADVEKENSFFPLYSRNHSGMLFIIKWRFW